MKGPSGVAEANSNRIPNSSSTTIIGNSHHRPPRANSRSSSPTVRNISPKLVNSVFIQSANYNARSGAFSNCRSAVFRRIARGGPAILVRGGGSFHLAAHHNGRQDGAQQPLPGCELPLPVADCARHGRSVPQGDGRQDSPPPGKG